MSPRTPGFHYAAFGLSCAYTLLVFCQLTAQVDAFPSDLPVHLDFVLHPDASPAAGYSLLHVLTGLMLKCTALNGVNARQFAAGAMLVLLVGAAYASMLAVYGYFKRAYPSRAEWIVQGCAVAVFLVSMIILDPVVHGILYLGIFTPNPWHNPTYLFGRFFSILAFCEFVRRLQPGERATFGRLAWLALVAALSVWGKPSFLIGFLPAALTILGWGWLRRWFPLTEVLKLAAAFVPAVVVLFWIDHKVYAAATAQDQVLLAPGQGWGLYTPSFALSIGLGMLFPLYVVAVRWRDPSRALLTAAVTWAASCAAFLLLAETGSRAAHANFAWCYMSGMFFLHFAAIGDWFLGPPSGHRIVRWIGTALFLLHLLSGVRYFLRVLGGGSYA